MFNVYEGPWYIRKCRRLFKTHLPPPPPPPSAAYMRRWTGSVFAQVMACHLFGAKPLPELMLTCCQLGPWERNKFQWNSNQNTKFSIMNMHLKMGVGVGWVGGRGVGSGGQGKRFKMSCPEHTSSDDFFVHLGGRATVGKDHKCFLFIRIERVHDDTTGTDSV